MIIRYEVITELDTTFLGITSHFLRLFYDTGRVHLGKLAKQSGIFVQNMPRMLAFLDGRKDLPDCLARSHKNQKDE